MKTLKWGAIAAGVAIGGGMTAMALTNPDQPAYEAFATRALISYVKNHVCIKAPFGLQQQCSSLIDQNQPEIKQFIAQGTQRQDFFFFSIYSTDLSIGPWVPSYHFETIGIFRKFHVYKVQEQ